MGKFDQSFVESCREQFPALARRHGGNPAVFFDGPAGTQVPVCVADAMREYLLNPNANHGGLFATAIESDEWLKRAHQAFADFVGANDADEIVFGQNMTSLTFSISRAVANTWNAGDEIIVTALDHDANISPWVLAAREKGVVVKWVRFDESDYTLNLNELEQQLSNRTRLVAVGCASNATGGLNPVKKICELARSYGALTFLDAVHYGPHGLIDVQEWDCDFLACSAYKFFGPHLGIVWGRRELLETLTAYKVRPSKNKIPNKWMTGTQSHESIVGGMACVDYLADIGRSMASDPSLNRREGLVRAFAEICDYEAELSEALMEGLSSIDGIKIWGISQTSRVAERFPTFSITHDAIKTPDLAHALCEHGIFVWHGHYYAIEFTERSGLEPEGMVRIGLVHYNTQEEIERLCLVLKEIVANTLSSPS